MSAFFNVSRRVMSTRSPYLSIHSFILFKVSRACLRSTTSCCGSIPSVVSGLDGRVLSDDGRGKLNLHELPFFLQEAECVCFCSSVTRVLRFSSDFGIAAVTYFSTNLHILCGSASGCGAPSTHKIA